MKVVLNSYVSCASWIVLGFLTAVAAYRQPAAQEKSAAQEKLATKNAAQQKEQLAALQGFIGQWRGVGQLRRGSRRGAWIEKSEWAWKFSDKTTEQPQALITFEAPKAKYLRRGEFHAPSSAKNDGEEAAHYRLTATTPGDKKLKYAGLLEEEDKLVLTTDRPQTGLPARITLRLVAGGDRLVVLYERASSAGKDYSRLAEVGYTRQGSDFGKGVSFVECVVTGGRGTIAVAHQGKTYYVCCTGCRDYFNEDPEGVLAEYRQKKAKEKEK